LFDENNETVNLILDHKFQEPISKVNWVTCGFSHNDDFIYAGVNSSEMHIIYIWDNYNGRLLVTLEGPKDGLSNVIWHPKLPIIFSCPKSCNRLDNHLFLWSNFRKVFEKNQWSSFFDSTDFVTVDENIIYQEKEDEFDINEDKIQRILKNVQENEEFINIITVDKVFDSDSDNDDIQEQPNTKKIKKEKCLSVNPKNSIDLIELTL
jgi:COMPASS component SWD1